MPHAHSAPISFARRELTQKIKGLETQLEEAREEAQRHHKVCTEGELIRRRLQTELDEARAQLAQVSQKLAMAQEASQHFEARIQRETATLAAELAEIKGRPVPPDPSEVRQQVMLAFGAATASLCRELALRTGLAASDSDVVIADSMRDFEPVAMDTEGVSLEAKAETYLRAAMDRAVRAVEPARLEAIDKWRGELKRRRILQGQLQEIKGSIRVMCRVRPTAAGEGEPVLTLPTSTDVVLTQPGRDGRRSFTFDHAFGPTSNQAAVFEEVEPVVESVLEGFNVCIFAYGQTGSGKTFTMGGVPGHSELAGINPRALRHLFELVAERTRLASMRSSTTEDEAWSYEVSLSYLEIYNENLRDLLVPKDAGKDSSKKKAGLDVRSLPNEPVSVPGLTSVRVQSADEVEDALERGGLRRSVAATKCNAQSSRSHSICIVSVTGRHQRSGATTHGKLHLVDLAGSERVKKSDVSGQAMLEAQAINKSLSALGNVMAKLQEKAKHIPFRDSKLTQLLADSLGGNSKTFMFVNINPSAEAASESLCSLEFALRVRKIELGKASGRRVEGVSLPELKAAKAAEDRAQTELKTAQARLAELETANRLATEAHHAIEAELNRERASLQSYQETETFLKDQGEERQRLELSEERKRTANAERQMKELVTRLQAAEEQLQSMRAERGKGGAGNSWTPPSAPVRPVTQAEALEAVAALRQHAADSLSGLHPADTGQSAPAAFSNVSLAKVTPDASSTIIGDRPAGLWAAMEEVCPLAKPAAGVPDLMHMDAVVLCDAPLLHPLGGAGLASDPMPTLDEEEVDAPPRSVDRRRSPRRAKPASTPVHRFTPSRLVLASDAARSSRKVQFNFYQHEVDADDAGTSSDAEPPPFPTFSLADAKEDRFSGNTSAASGVLSSSKYDHNKRPRPNFKFEPLASNSLGSSSLGRAFAGGAARRPLASRSIPIGMAAGSISKAPAANRRRSSIAAHVQRNGSRRPSLAPSADGARRHTNEWK